jgi:hypothetical protein
MPGTPEWNALYEAAGKQSTVAKETGIPDQCLDDPLLLLAMLKYNKIKEL